MRIGELLRVGVCVVLSGCGSMAWKTVVEKDAPSTFIWQGDTLWGSGAQAALRRPAGGTWERVEMCAADSTGTVKFSASLAFEGAAVWALCQSSGVDKTQKLLRHDGSGTATVIDLPIDGDLILVPLLSGPPALVGNRSLYLWNGTGWDNKGDHLQAAKPQTVGRGAGVSSSEIYMEVAGLNTDTLMWWNGTRWAVMLGESSGPPTLRFGKAWSGLLSLEGGYLTPIAIKGEKGLKDKNLTLASMLTEDTLLAVRGNGTQYYSIGVNDTEPVAMGVAPMGDRSGQAMDVPVVDVYGNVGTILSRGDNGSGVSFVYGLDRNTVLIGSTTGGGLGGGSAFTTLLQGSR